METTTCAYMAGIMDGEGHFSIVFHKPKNRHHLIVGVMNTDAQLMDWLLEKFGGTIYRRTSPSNKAHWKDRYEWRMAPSDAERLIPLIKPFLVIKREQAQTVLDFRKTFASETLARRKMTPEIIAEREYFRDRLASLNGRRTLL